MSARATNPGSQDMTEIAQSINLNIAEKLRDREYRQKFFLAETSASIARQLIALRKRRELDQGQLAAKVGTQQPAISRIEQADYQNWSFNTLRKIAAALDARITVTIQPAEDVLQEYEPQSELPEETYSIGNLATQEIIANGWSAAPIYAATGTGSYRYEVNSAVGMHRYNISPISQPVSASSADDKDLIIAELQAKVAQLEDQLGLPATEEPFGLASLKWPSPQTSSPPVAVRRP